MSDKAQETRAISRTITNPLILRSLADDAMVLSARNTDLEVLGIVAGHVATALREFANVIESLDAQGVSGILDGRA